jgi:predicted N-acetyltransferase YhbS
MIELKNLAVTPTHQRRGIGAHLIQLGLKHYAGQLSRDVSRHR